MWRPNPCWPEVRMNVVIIRHHTPDHDPELCPRDVGALLGFLRSQAQRLRACLQCLDCIEDAPSSNRYTNRSKDKCPECDSVISHDMTSCNHFIRLTICPREGVSSFEKLRREYAAIGVV